MDRSLLKVFVEGSWFRGGTTKGAESRNKSEAEVESPKSKENKLGLWSGQFMLPWNWRKQNR